MWNICILSFSQNCLHILHKSDHHWKEFINTFHLKLVWKSLLAYWLSNTQNKNEFSVTRTFFPKYQINVQNMKNNPCNVNLTAWKSQANNRIIENIQIMQNFCKTKQNHKICEIGKICKKYVKNMRAYFRQARIEGF